MISKELKGFLESIKTKERDGSFYLYDEGVSKQVMKLTSDCLEGDCESCLSEADVIFKRDKFFPIEKDIKQLLTLIERVEKVKEYCAKKLPQKTEYGTTCNFDIIKILNILEGKE